MKQILMIDDVATNLICAAEVLRQSYDVSTAKSGRQALLMLNEMNPDLIMLDVNMPQMDGYEVFAKLKENPEWANIPVVFLTAESDMAKEVKCLEMGAMDFIRKPFDPEVMKTRVDKIMAITQEKKELEGAVNKDSLTHLSTRKALENFMMSPGSEKGYFLLLDLDNFKKVNDTYGHVIGDSVLVKMAHVFEEVIGSNGKICRLGGDEFAIFLNAHMGREEVKELIRKLIATSEFEISDLIADFTDFKVSVSVGVSIKPDDAIDFQNLYMMADKALYYVKQNGKRGFHFYESMGDIEEALIEDTKINLLQLQRLISENDDESGAYKVEYEGFKRIYRFVSRCMDRKNQDVQIVLFSLSKEDGSLFEKDNPYIVKLGENVTTSLRRGDVATQCGYSQYVVILMDANEENGDKVADRIKDKFLEEFKEESIQLNYEIETVKADSSK